VRAPGHDARRKRLVDAAGQLKTGFRQLEVDFQNRLSRARAAEWREIDALLRVPMIDLQVRRSLLDRARELSPIPAFQEGAQGSDPPDEPETDKTILAQALA